MWGWWVWSWWTWVIWIFIIFLLIWLLVSPKNVSFRTGRDPAEDIVRQRYARGEITKEEFDRLLKDLRT